MDGSYCIPAGSSLGISLGFNEFGQCIRNKWERKRLHKSFQMTSPAGATLSVNDVKNIYICGNGVHGSLFFTERQRIIR